MRKQPSEVYFPLRYPIRHPLCPLLPILSLCFSLAGCSKPEPVPDPEVAVTTGSVLKTRIQGVIDAEGVLFPLHQASITPKISTPVKQFLVNRGSKVRQGQLLAILESKDLSAVQLENRGAYEQAQAEAAITTTTTLPEDLQKAQLDAEAAKQAYENEQKVYESRQKLFQEGALPRKEVDLSNVSMTQAKNAFELAQKHLAGLQEGASQQHRKAAQGQLTAAEGKYLGAAAQLSYTRIVSPIDGVITDRPIYPGETPAAGLPLLVVMDASRVIAKSHISADQAGRLKIGNSAAVTAPGLDQPVSGKVTLVSPALDPNSTTVEVWVEVPNKDGNLRPGSTVHLSMVTETVNDALVIPIASLLTSADGPTTVMVVTADSHAHQQPVEVGIRQEKEKQVQITKGLKEGDRVVVSGAYGLPDNTKIKEETPAAANPAEKGSGAN